jgi:hypothetical protein
MGFFDFLRGGAPDPTKDWPVAHGTPAVNVAFRTVGFLTFGDPLEKAKSLGRPDRYTQHGPGTCSLDYRSRGFAIEYEVDRFVEIAYFIGPGGLTPGDPAPTYARPSTPAGTSLTPDVTPADVRGEYGDPDGGGDGTLTYVRDGFVQEFAFDDGGRLATWTLYLD